MTISSSLTQISLIIGTYTTNTTSQGIYVIDYDINVNKITHQYSIPAHNPSFLHYIGHRKTLLFVEELGDFQGKLKSLQLDVDQQQYQMISEQPVQGNAPCHIALDPDSKHVIVSNYMSGNFTTFGLDDKGGLSEALSSYQFTGKSIHPTRQTKSHIHSAFFSPNAQKVFIQDLGADRIYQFDRGLIYENGSDYKSLFLPKGAGPRHLAFSSAPVMYILNELEACIDAYSLNSNQEADQLLQRVYVSHDISDNRKSLAAQIRISKDERFVYVSNRGEKNELVVFKIAQGGQLVLLQSVPSGGKGPRHFEFTADESLVFVANQYSNNVCIFKRDKETGLLENTRRFIAIPSPVFIAVEN